MTKRAAKATEASVKEGKGRFISAFPGAAPAAATGAFRAGQPSKVPLVPGGHPVLIIPQGDPLIPLPADQADAYEAEEEDPFAEFTGDQ